MSAHHCSLMAGPPQRPRGRGGSIPLESVVDVPLAWEEGIRTAQGYGESFAQPGERVLVLAAGPLVGAARAIATLREELHEGVTDAAPADEPRLWRNWDRVIALSRTGDEPELLHFLRHLPPRVRRTALCVDSVTTLRPLVDDPLSIPVLAGRTAVAYETTAIIAARAAMGADVSALPTQAKTIVDSDLPSFVPGVDHLVFVASGWASHIAGRCARVLSADRDLRAEAHSLRDAHYGAIDHADERSIVWFIGKSSAEARDRASARGAVVVNSKRDPLLDYVEVHRMLIELAAARGEGLQG